MAHDSSFECARALSGSPIGLLNFEKKKLFSIILAYDNDLLLFVFGAHGLSEA